MSKELCLFLQIRQALLRLCSISLPLSYPIREDLVSVCRLYHTDRPILLWPALRHIVRKPDLLLLEEAPFFSAACSDRSHKPDQKRGVFSGDLIPEYKQRTVSAADGVLIPILFPSFLPSRKSLHEKEVLHHPLNPGQTMP